MVWISYGIDNHDLWRKAAEYVDRILKGEKPADLPVQAPTKYELVINLKAAKALGLKVPPDLFARANNVMRMKENEGECPLLALSGHRLVHRTCLLWAQSGHRELVLMSAFDPKRHDFVSSCYSHSR